MIVNILSPEDDATQIEGFTVVVDVFRAFSTSYFIHSNNIKKVNIYCTAKLDSLYGEEDYLFAEYLKSKLLNKNISFEDIVVRLRNGSGRGFKKDGFAPYTDFLLCMDIDRFNYILKRKITDKSIELVKI